MNKIEEISENSQSQEEEKSFDHLSLNSEHERKIFEEMERKEKEQEQKQKEKKEEEQKKKNDTKNNKRLTHKDKYDKKLYHHKIEEKYKDRKSGPAQ